MRLLAFQILNCFGFRNSGRVNLQDSYNLIYILGRNSSGKSSLLNAIKYFDLGIVPKEQPNFRNFNAGEDNQFLIAEYSIEESDLSLDRFMRDFYNKYKQLDKYALDSNDKLKSLVSTIEETYRGLIEELAGARVANIEKTANGHYLFAQYHPFENFYSRQKKISDAIIAAREPSGRYRVKSTEADINDLNFNAIEDLLFGQFPRVTIFNQSYSLDQSLPERITHSNIAPTKGEFFLKAFVDYLGRDDVQSFLSSDDPDEIHDLVVKLQNRVNELTEKVNQHKGDTDNKDLLEIRLHEKNGLQITVLTDSKKSYYAHLSDNTKFLFAYYLYLAGWDFTGNILLFDEPNNGFHPTAQKFLLNFLESLAANQNLVIVSTHSEYLININRLSGVRLMSVDDKRNITVKNHFYNQPKDKGDYLALQPLFDAIGFSFGKQIVIKDKVNITEGVTDMLYLRAFNIILKHGGELNIAPARSDSHILSLIPLLISQGITFKIVIDTSRIKEKIQDSYEISDDYIYEIPVSAGFPVKESGIEDLFTKEDFKKLLMAIGETIEVHYDKVPNSIYIKGRGNAKRLIAHHVYSNVNDYDETYFETETVENFRKVLDFCKKDVWFAI